MAVEFRLLGQVDLALADRGVDLGPGKQRCVVAALLWSPGDAVSVPTLVERVWGEEPPAGARKVLYTYVARLRRILDSVCELAKVRGGYALRVDPEQVDLGRYRRLVRTARRHHDTGERAALLREAVALWREPLAGLPGSWAAAVRETLEQQHIDTLAEWARAELAIGRSGDVLDHLPPARARHPFAEPLVEQHLTALSLRGRTDEALDVFRRYRTRLADELGLDPGEAVRQVHDRILRGEPAAPAETGRTRPPRQLPPDPQFTGRVAELTALDAMLGSGARVCVVGGRRGIGKTALATHWAHRVAARFPDGQLYVSMSDRTPFDVLGQLLRALGTTTVPDSVPERTNLYRSLTADSRLLVVLDDAASPDQVRPLLSGGPGCLTLITSRHRLAGLVAVDGARLLSLFPLTPNDSNALLRTMLGPERAASEPNAVAELAAQCGHVPMALRVRAANLLLRPGSSVAATAAERAFQLSSRSVGQTSVCHTNLGDGPGTT